jgi:hypothetical protein
VFLGYRRRLLLGFDSQARESLVSHFYCVSIRQLTPAYVVLRVIVAMIRKQRPTLSH